MLLICHFKCYRVSGKSERWISLPFPDKYPFFLDIFNSKCHQIEGKLLELSTSLSTRDGLKR